MNPALNGIDPDEKSNTSTPPLSWINLLWFFGLLVVCYGPVLVRLVNQWNQDEDMGHGFFVPLVAAYIVWQKRDHLLALTPEPNPWGLLLILWGALQLFVATLGAELFLARTAFLISLLGVVLYLGGTRYIKVVRFPLFLLFFMVPLPAIIYNQITLPLQFLASSLAENILGKIGIPVFREGNILELPSQRLNVVEACSGIRSLLSLSFLSLVYGYFFEKKTWMKIFLFVITVPIAILANAGRVTVTGILSERDPALAEGFMHSASGWVIFMVALVSLIAVHQIVNGVYQRVHARH